LAGLQGNAARLEGGRKSRTESRLSSFHQRSVDGYEASQSQNKLREKSIVDRLCEGDHPVEVGLRPERSVELFKEAIDRNYVHIKFTMTRGGTELGVRLDRDACDFSRADFENENGTVHIVGGLTLDYVKVKCIADIDLGTLEGAGHLEKVEVQAAS
jgi:Core binding factor beta subunit